ncbi:MAG: hypothetical protein ACI9EW_002721 [Cellvibrionaceae bacterium]|jgi:hypothetical protein
MIQTLKKNFLSPILFLILVGLSGSVIFGRTFVESAMGQTSSANQQIATSFSNTTLVELRADILPDAPRFLSSSNSRRAPQTATFNVNFNPASCGDSVAAWPTDAQNAFETATSIWGAILKSSQIIEVDACWLVLDSNILGSARSVTYHGNFTNAPSDFVWYPAAVANAIADQDLAPNDSDILANFNSNFSSWYFGTDGNPASNQYDFTTTILHEIGHGLGFSGSMRLDTKTNTTIFWGLSGYPLTYDQFTENELNQSLINTVIFPNNSAALTSQLTGGNVFFDGPEASAANGGSPVKLYSPGTWRSGSSYSHLDEIFNGTNEALMTYSLSPGEVQHNPGPIIKGLLNDLGWNVTSEAPTPIPTSTATATVAPTPIPTSTATATVASNQFSLTTGTTGNGKGAVGQSVDAASYPFGTIITLTAVAFPGSAFSGWSGACAAEPTATCTITIDANLSVMATFVDLPGPGFNNHEPLNEPAAGNTVTEKQVTFNWEGAIEQAGEAPLKQYILSMTVTVPTRAATIDSIASEVVGYTFTTTDTSFTPSIALPNGIYEWAISAEDTAGNVTPAGVAFSFTRLVGATDGFNVIYLPLITQ